MTEVQQHSAMAGELLCGRFRLQELVGRGAAAAVYRALDEALGREVAVKIYSKEGGEPELLVRQEAEIRILASLIHPGLVTLFDAGTDPAMERSFVVMEYVPGPDLRRQLRDGQLGPAGIATLGYDLASALDYVHSRGVIHRDVKPGNVLLYDRRPGQAPAGWRAKLADFGIARVLEEDHLTIAGRTVGTAAYLSPEQALGQDVTGASDVYSLGLVLLECFTRHVEFPGSHIESGVARLNRDPAVPDNIGAGWKHLLAAMTARQPNDRPSAAEAAGELQQLALPVSTHTTVIPAAGGVAAGPVPKSPPPVVPAHPPRWATRHKTPGKGTLAAIGACLAAAGLIGASPVTFGGGAANQPTPPAVQAVPVHNNPVDFHLDQLESALQPSAAFQSRLGQVRLAVSAGDFQAALNELDGLEREVSDVAAGGSVALEKYQDITSAIRLVRGDLQTLLTASAGSTAHAVPAVPEPSPLSNPDLAPAVEPQPAPAVDSVIVNAPPPQQDPSRDQIQTKDVAGKDNERSNTAKAGGGGKNKD